MTPIVPAMRAKATRAAGRRPIGASTWEASLDGSIGCVSLGSSDLASVVFC